MTQLSLAAAHKVLPAFLNQYTKSRDHRTATITALVLTFNQLRGPLLGQRGIHMLFGPTGTPDQDPVNGLAADLLYRLKARVSKLTTVGLPCTHVEDSLHRMRHSALMARKAKSGSPDYQRCITEYETQFYTHQANIHGSGLVRSMRNAWSPEFGLITDLDSHGFIRIETKQDRESFLTRMEQAPETLILTAGYGRKLAVHQKLVSLSGSLSSRERDNANWSVLIRHGAPLLILPHDIATLPQHDSIETLKNIVEMWASMSAGCPAQTYVDLPEHEFVKSCLASLRSRLSILPHNYGFCIMQIVHQLFAHCMNIANFQSQLAEPQANAVELLFWDLYSHSLRGILLCVYGLAWHGMGLDLPCSPDTARKVLCVIREHGEISKRELLRTTPIRSADQREQLLIALEQAHIVRAEGKLVSSVEYAEFVRLLYRHPEIPYPGSPESFLRPHRSAEK